MNDETMADYWRDVKPAMQEASQQRRAECRAFVDVDRDVIFAGDIRLNLSPDLTARTSA